MFFKDSHASGVIPILEMAKRKKVKLSFIEHEKELKTIINKNTFLIYYAQINNITGGGTWSKNLFIKVVKSKNKNCIIMNDIAQAICHEIIDFKYSDALLFSGSKLYGPTGTGCLILKEKLINILLPMQLGGGMNRNFWWKSNEHHWTGYKKWEAGTPNVAGIFWIKTHHYDIFLILEWIKLFHMKRNYLHISIIN